MNILEQLSATQDPVVRKMIEAHRKSVLEDYVSRPPVANFDNQPTWDNWSKKPDPFKKKTIYFRNK